ncbi:MAG: hypothetical protein ABR977_06445, partial [Candidatus Dormibacteria bacterium]
MDGAPRTVPAQLRSERGYWVAFVSSRRLPALRGPRSRQVRVVMAGVALAGVAAGVWALVIGRDTPQMLLLLALGGSVAGIGFA